MDRKVKQFLNSKSVVEIMPFIDEKAVRNEIIKQDFYLLIQSMSHEKAYEKIKNDFRVSRSLIIKVITGER